MWYPQNFNTLQIEDRTLGNGNMRRTSYELVPMRSGTARHTEAFTKKDFWVTRYNPQQSFVARDLPNYVSDRQSTVGQDLVIWYTGSEHHESHSRDEDFNTVPVLWTGFQLILKQSLRLHSLLPVSGWKRPTRSSISQSAVTLQWVAAFCFTRVILTTV